MPHTENFYKFREPWRPNPKLLPRSKQQNDITETIEWQQIAPHGGTDAMARALINNKPSNYFSLVEASKDKLTATQYQALYNHGSRILQMKASRS